MQGYAPRVPLASRLAVGVEMLCRFLIESGHRLKGSGKTPRAQSPTRPWHGSAWPVMPRLAGALGNLMPRLAPGFGTIALT